MGTSWGGEGSPRCVPPPLGAHQLPQGPQRPDVFGEPRQAVAAGVEDAQGQEAEAGGQRAQLVAAAGGAGGGGWGAAGVPPCVPPRPLGRGGT